MKRGILFLLLTTFWGVFVEAGNNKEVPVSNLRVPAYPLVTIDPYISAWSHTDKLYEDEVRHWTGTEHSLTGVLRVDGKCYRFMGKGEQALTSILKDARDEEWTARYTNTMPYADWYTKEYNDTVQKHHRANKRDITDSSRYSYLRSKTSYVSKYPPDSTRF